VVVVGIYRLTIGGVMESWNQVVEITRSTGHHHFVTVLDDYYIELIRLAGDTVTPASAEARAYFGF